MAEEKDEVLSDEALAEQEKETVAEGDALRAKIVTELGLEDNEDNKELIDKVVTREGGLRKGFGKLLRSHKNLKATKTSATVVPPVDDKPNKPLTTEEVTQLASAAADKRADDEFLEDSEYSDEIQADIRAEAARLKCSARKASKSEFIRFKIGEEKKKKDADEAADNGSTPGKKKLKTVDASKPLNPADYDLSTKEGRDAWEAAKKSHKDARGK